MATAAIQTSFVTGEVAPSLFGHVDLARMRGAASTMRNCWVSYRGPSYSRAGTKFVGFSKQTGRTVPPRLIPFQFSVNQGLALEFGNFYMRVVKDGGFVTEPALVIIGATQANPAVITTASFTAASAIANNGSVSASYNPGDTVTLTGGTFTSAAVLGVTNTALVSIAINNAGNGTLGANYRGYAGGDTITLLGGTYSAAPILGVVTTKVVAAQPNVSFPGTGGAPGPAVVTGTTGTGTKFQANVTIGGGGGITSVNSLAVVGSYTVNPTFSGSPFFAYLEPVTGGGLTGARLTIAMGVATVSIIDGGTFSQNAVGGTFTQALTSGGGLGATFNTALFGPRDLTIASGGVYSVAPTNPVAQGSTSGTGAGATFDLTFTAGSGFNNGDWVVISGVGGMTELNGDTFVVTPTSSTTFQLFDVYGNPINSTAFGAYTSGGLVSRIFTLATPWAEADLAFIKFTQSADVMTLCCVNQNTRVEYLQQDLSRFSDTNWTLSPAVPTQSVVPPASASGVTSSAGTITYQYEVTAVSPTDGTESSPSPIAEVAAGVDLDTTPGSITLTWVASTTIGVNEYNIYKATPGFSAPPPVGALFGYAGSAFGTEFIDRRIVADFSQVPPRFRNPFARGQLIGARVTAGGAAYTFVGFTITTAAGSGAVLTGVLVGAALAAIIVEEFGQNYAPTDTVTVTGDGTGATATLTIGPLTGTYPSLPTYFQQRRGYANTLNNPDTYWFSQPGAFNNFDSRIPTIASDSFSGSPWSVQVNGIQFFVDMPGGLVAFTGLSAWQLTGSGGSSFTPQPIGPDSQQVQPQAHNGCSPTVPPIKIDNNIIFVPAKGSFYREIAYQIGSNIYTGTDITINSPHLFQDRTIREHAWCEEPFKLLWAVRDDGTMVTLTYLKPQEVVGWSRSDTNGSFESVCSVSEPPVDALYLATQRFPGIHTAYMIERMDNRDWQTVEDLWCVDCGLALAQPEPAATLNASSPTGLGACSAVTGLVGGSNYGAATTATVVDDDGEGPGTGAVVALTIVAGVITAVSFSTQGTGYVRPKLVISDPSNQGSGADAVITLDNSATFTASAAVFTNPTDIGKVIRMGGGSATITGFTSTTVVTANITAPIIDTIPNSGTPPRVRAQVAGTWTMSTPVTTISGLKHLAGATVTGLADGAVITPTTVSATGTITLSTPASAVVVGLGFQAQLQSVYLEGGSPTVQGQRKKVAAATVRIENSRGLKVGCNQPDGSTLSPPQLAPPWSNLADVPDKGEPPYGSTIQPLYTGDVRVPVGGGYATPGQVAVQQDFPLPLQVMAFIPELFAGDLPQSREPQQRQQEG